MTWLRLAILFLAAAAMSFGGSFLSLAWKRRRKSDPETLRLQSMLPGYDCALCGFPDCPSYARAIDKAGADPALCSPGGSRLESRLRSQLSEREGESRGQALRAVVRCGGREGLADRAYSYDGRRDCRSAADKYGGPKACKDGCLGFGSCAAACPIGAIQLVSGIAIVKPTACTGCGLCVEACPKGLITLVPREGLWYVACSSRRESRLKEADCRAACTACGECSDRSNRFEFILGVGLARENSESTGGNWAAIATHCPSGAIALAGAEKKRPSPFRKKER